MLTIPAFAYYSDLRVTAYQDDSMFWKFVYIPDYISVRRDVNGNPVFLLVKYAFGDQDREENPDLGRGGGYLAFDVEMSVPEADLEVLRDRLQTHVDEQWNQLKALADAGGKSVKGARLKNWYHHDGRQRTQTLSVDDVRLGLPQDVPQAPPGDAPPKVILATPTWTEGTFAVTAPQSDALVSHRVTEGKVSLIGNNTAAVSMDLTEAGATFMERTLVNLDGSGATDLTPIQVTYDLKFWARIPPIRLRVEADSRSLYQSLQTIEHDYDGHSCEEDDMYHYQTKMQMAIDANLIRVRFDTGTLELDDDFLQEIRSTAMGLVQDLIKDKFYRQEEAPPPADDGTADFVNADKDIYFLDIEQNIEFSSIEYDEEITSIVEWPARPQGTMQAFFSGLSAAQMKKYVRVVDLDDDFFKTLGLTVSAFADWEHEPIAFVEVQLRYDGRDENGQLVEKVETFTFSEENTTGEWDPSLIGAKRDYDYRWRVAFDGREPGDWSRWQRDRTPHLNLSIADAGKVSVRVLAGNIDFAQTVEQVQVEMSYADSASDVEEEAMTFVLTDGQREGLFERYIFTEWDKPVRYRATFFLKDGQRIVGEEEETVSRQLLINAPLFDKLDVKLVPTGAWSGVVQSVVSLEYEDEPNDFRADEAYQLKTIDEFKSWAVVLRNPDHRVFRYKVLTTFSDGGFTETAWNEADGDQALPIVVRENPMLEIGLLPNLIDFSSTPVVECTLRYSDDAGGVREVETFTFTEATPTVWSLPIADADRVEYRYELIYHKADGDAVRVAETATDATKLVIPKLLMPEVSCTLVPQLLNFAETPVVVADLSYEDDERGIRASDTLIFTDATEQTFRVPVHEDSPLAYRLTVTYHLADGSVVEREPVTLDKKRIVLPRYLPQLVPVG